jgi:isoleucyl-tRNA synthetase
LPLFGGQNIWKAVPVIIESLRQAGRLLATGPMTHSYPHCWRHKSPVIYRAAAQWFIRMDEGEGVFTKDKAPQTLRQLALHAIDRTGFYPENGRARLRDMIANRPDWCISRQRSWGVPLPFFLHKATAASCIRARWRSSTAPPTSSKRGGIEAWSRHERRGDAGRRRRRPLHQEQRHPGSLVRLRLHLRARAAPAAPRRPPAAEGPEADLYLEGHDQHRGWFHSRCCWAARCTTARPTAAC